MSMMNRQMPSSQNQHHSNKIRLSTLNIYALYSTYLFLSFFGEFHAHTLASYACLRHYLFTYIYIYLFILCAWWISACFFLLCRPRIYIFFRLACFFLLLYLFSSAVILIGCQKGSPNLTWQNVWKENKRASKYHHARIRTHALVHKVKAKTFTRPTHSVFSLFHSFKTQSVYILTKSWIKTASRAPRNRWYCNNGSYLVFKGHQAAKKEKKKKKIHTKNEFTCDDFYVVCVFRSYFGCWRWHRCCSSTFLVLSTPLPCHSPICNMCECVQARIKEFSLPHSIAPFTFSLVFFHSRFWCLFFHFK